MRICVAPILAVALCQSLPAATPVPYVIDTVAGSSMVGDGGPATMAPLRDAQSIYLDAGGNLYIADAGDHRIRRISAGGVITTVAGTGFPTKTDLNLPYGVAVDSSGNVFVADLGNNRVRRIDSNGNASTAAANLPSPRNVLSDAAGNVYIAEFSGHRIVRLDPTGAMTTIAGTGVSGSGGDGGPALLAQLSYPAGMAVDRAGNLYIADSGNHKIRKVSAAGVITTVLGTGVGGSASAAQLNTPTGVAVDPSGTLYIADSGNQRIRRLTASGVISTIPLSARDVALDAAGNLFVAAGTQVYKVLPNGAQAVIAGDGSYFLRGDGGPATSARLNVPSAAALDANGTLWISDKGNSRLRTVSRAGSISSVPAPASGLFSPAGLSFTGTGDLLIADSTGEAIRDLSAASLTRVAGNGMPGYTGDGFQATGSSLLSPSDVQFTPGGGFFLADTANHRIRRVNSGGTLVTVVGNGVRGWNGDGMGTAVQIDSPGALALDSGGTLYFADTGNNRIRRLTADGVVSTLSTPMLNAPRGLAVDNLGNVFIADTNNHRILLIAPDTTATTIIAGTGAAGFAGDGDVATRAQLSSPVGLFLDRSTGVLYIADSGNQRIRRLTPAPAAPIESPASSVAVVNAATLQPGPVAPCSLVSIFAPSAGATTTAVLFDGQPAVTVSAEGNQVTAQIPCATVNQASTLLQLSYSGTAQPPITLSVANAAPGLFTLSGGTGQAVAANQDGSTNSQVNAAARGSVITLYATGAGVSNSIGVIFGATAGTVQFAGDAPGLIGLTQVNATLPPDATGIVPVILLAGNVPSQAGVTLAVE